MRIYDLNVKIRTFFIALNIFLLVIAGFSASYLFSLREYSVKLKDMESQRYALTQKADELRRSSDDLTRFARTYANTLDETYKANYFKILDIRNAKAPRPRDYEGIYWDLTPSQRALRHPLGNSTSIKEEMKKLPYTRYEYEKFLESEANSNGLTNLEIEAFNALAKLDKDVIDGSAEQFPANQILAIRILNSQAYHEAKEKIMLPLDELLFSIKERTQKSIKQRDDNLENAFNALFALLFFGALAFIVVIFAINKKILSPISNLTRTILSFKQGEDYSTKAKYYDDEIGLMSKHFLEMKKKQDENHAIINKLGQTDPLTNTLNRRAFFDISERLIRLLNRSEGNLSLMILDIDFFKKINDEHGHLIGDEILKHFVQNVKKVIRESDVLARYGGEEFIIMLPQTDKNGALKLAEKIRRSISDHAYEYKKETIKITASVGVSEYVKDEKIELLIQRADEALFMAKKEGRNGVKAK